MLKPRDLKMIFLFQDVNTPSNFIQPGIIGGRFNTQALPNHIYIDSVQYAMCNTTALQVTMQVCGKTYSS